MLSELVAKIPLKRSQRRLFFLDQPCWGKYRKQIVIVHRIQSAITSHILVSLSEQERCIWWENTIYPLMFVWPSLYNLNIPKHKIHCFQDTLLYGCSLYESMQIVNIKCVQLKCFECWWTEKTQGIFGVWMFSGIQKWWTRICTCFMHDSQCMWVHL